MNFTPWVIKMKEYKNKGELKSYLKKCADKENIKFNSNEKIVDNILTGLLKRNETKGDIYCPCRVVTGDKKKDKNIACPCIYHMNEIEQDGHCKCNLFVR